MKDALTIKLQQLRGSQSRTRQAYAAVKERLNLESWRQAELLLQCSGISSKWTLYLPASVGRSPAAAGSSALQQVLPAVQLQPPPGKKKVCAEDLICKPRTHTHIRSALSCECRHVYADMYVTHGLLILRCDRKAGHYGVGAACLNPPESYLRHEAQICIASFDTKNSLRPLY